MENGMLNETGSIIEETIQNILDTIQYNENGYGDTFGCSVEYRDDEEAPIVVIDDPVTFASNLATMLQAKIAG